MPICTGERKSSLQYATYCTSRMSSIKVNICCTNTPREKGIQLQNQIPAPESSIQIDFLKSESLYIIKVCIYDF